MFKLYQSNNIEVLKYILLEILQKKLLNNSHINEIIIIPNNNISFLLKIFLAKYLGICANIKFVLPAKFVWDIYRSIISNVPETNFFNKRNLTFIIVKLLPNILYKKEFIDIRRYLKKNYTFEKLFFLSTKIADLYDKYLIYRIDWLIKWEKFKLVEYLHDKNQLWQSCLWREISKYYNDNFSNVLSRTDVYCKFIKIFNKKNKLILDNIPNEIFIFNVSFIPYIYLKSLFLISKFTKINYLISNPSKEYWYDGFFYGNQNRLKNKNIERNIFFLYSKDYYNFFNSSLLYYGRYFSEYFRILYEFNFKEVNLYVKYNENNILNRFKNNVLFFKDLSLINSSNELITDNSISINSCYGYLREIEILYDYILDLVLNYSYKPDDIIIIVSDLNLYIPYIKAVFNNNIYEKYLPFHIINENFNFGKDIIDIFFYILELPTVNISINELLYFLNKEIILKKFDINNNEYEIIINLINNIGLYSELNLISSNIEDNFNEFFIIDKIKSMLLGYAINIDFCIWNNIISYPNIGGALFNNSISKLADLVYKIIFWKVFLKKERFINNWIIISQEILFFLSNVILKNKKFILNNDFWKDLIFSINLTSDINKINSFLFSKIIFNLLNKKNVNKYLPGCINFCSLSLLQFVTFKVVCVIGMNDGVFPRNVTNNNYDLMFLNPRLGDRNKRKYDKYLFLEYIFAAREKFYISYVYFSLKSNKKKYPSILVDYLINYIKFNFSNNLNIKKIFKEIKFLCKKHTRNVFDKKNFFVNKYGYLSYQNEWKEKGILLKNKNKKIFKKKDPKELCLNNFYFFWFHPIKYFLINCVKINFFINNNFLEKNILFSLDIKKFYFMRCKIISEIFKKKKIYNNLLFFHLQYFNLLPVGTMGKIAWKNEKKKIVFLINKIKFSIFQKKSNLQFYLKLKEINLYGNIILYNSKIIKWTPKYLNFIDALNLFISHLIYCYLGGINNSYLYGYNGIWYFTPLIKDNAEFYLNKYINGYINGINIPLSFLPKSSNVWIFSAYNIYSKNKINNNYSLDIAKKKVYNILYGNNYFPGEIDDIYVSRLCRDINNINIDTVIYQSEKWLLPVLKFLKFN